jgi:8-oxo-dGTP diphosphatase
MFDVERRVLLARRPRHKPMAGYWEFPGGKLESHEAAEQGLARELREELGIELRRCHRLLDLRHDDAERSVALQVFIVDEALGEPQALEGQRLRWVSLGELPRQRLLPADRPIVDALARI